MQVLAIPLAGSAEHQHGPDEETTEQEHIGQIAVGQQMSQRPNFDR